MTAPDVASIADGLTEAQRRLLLDSDPDDITGREGCGIPIRGPQYRTAKSLMTADLGSYSHGSFYGDLYFNNPLGLAVRAHILRSERDA